MKEQGKRNDLCSIPTEVTTPTRGKAYTCERLKKQKRKAILLEKGKENQSHGKTAPSKTLLSTIDKSDKHNTREELAKELGWSTGKVSLADAIDEALESGEATQQRVENSQKVCIASCNTGVDVAEVDRWRKLRAIPDDTIYDMNSRCMYTR